MRFCSSSRRADSNFRVILARNCRAAGVAIWAIRSVCLTFRLRKCGHGIEEAVLLDAAGKLGDVAKILGVSLVNLDLARIAFS